MSISKRVPVKMARRCTFLASVHTQTDIIKPKFIVTVHGFTISEGEDILIIFGISMINVDFNFLTNLPVCLRRSPLPVHIGFRHTSPTSPIGINQNNIPHMLNLAWIWYSGRRHWITLLG